MKAMSISVQGSSSVHNVICMENNSYDVHQSSLIVYSSGRIIKCREDELNLSGSVIANHEKSKRECIQTG